MIRLHKNYNTPARLRAVLLFCLLSAGTAVLAQNISVENFYENKSDQDARIAYPKKDENNRQCAIIKMETPLLKEDFTFDSGMTGIRDSEQHTGEIWIWVPAGARYITINHKYLGVVRNYEFGTPLEEATVYILKLKSGTVEKVIRDEVNLQYLVVNCPIEGATIKIDTDAPETFVNGQFRKRLSYGRHTYTIEAPLYHPETGRIEITASTKPELNPQLRPAFGKIVLHTLPEEGADVFVDGEKKGKTPLSISLSSGTHAVRAMKEWYFPATETITVVDGDDKPVNISLQANFAQVTLNAKGDIYIEDQYKAAGRWSDRLPSGAYRVEVRKASHRSIVVSIEVKPGQDQTVNLPDPIPLYGSLDVNANVTGAEIYLDGEFAEKSPAIVQKVLIGEHILDLLSDGYKTYRQTVTVEEGKMLHVSPALQEDGSFLQRQKKKPVKTVFFAGYRGSLNAPAGISLGVCRAAGGYLSFGGGREQFAYTAGMMYRILPFLYGYTGYGAFTRKSPDGRYATDAALETGLTYRISSFTLSAGYTVAPFGKPVFGEGHVGIGWSF
jgi:hypothetical protein